MQDRIVVDFDALNKIAGCLQTASRELDAAADSLGGLSLTKDSGADARLKLIAINLKTVGAGMTAFSVSSALSTVKRAAGMVSDYSGALGGAVQSAASLFDETEGYLSGIDLEDVADPFGRGDTGRSASHAIWSVLSLFSPVTGLLYLTSGLAVGNIPSFVNDSRTPMSEAWTEGPGYQFAKDNPGITAWLGKAHAKAENQYASGEVNAYAGKAKAEAKLSGGFMEYKKSHKEYADSEPSDKEYLNLLYVEGAAGVALSAFAVDAKGSVGTDMLGVDGKGELAVGNAEAKVSGNLSIGEEGINAYASGKAMVSAAEGKASASFNFLGLEIKGEVGGYAGALGVEGDFGIKDGKFVAKGGVAAILGVSGGVEIGFNDEGWSNFVDFITFWD